MVMNSRGLEVGGCVESLVLRGRGGEGGCVHEHVTTHCEVSRVFKDRACKGVESGHEFTSDGHNQTGTRAPQLAPPTGTRTCKLAHAQNCENDQEYEHK